MYAFFLAMRYLRAHRIMYFAVGIAVIIVVTSLMGGFTRDLRRLVRGMQSHLQVDSMGAAITKEAAPMLMAIRKIPHVTVASPRHEYAAWMGIKGSRRPVRLIGIDIAAETTEEFREAFRRGGTDPAVLTGAWAVAGWDLPIEKDEECRLVTARDIPGAAAPVACVAPRVDPPLNFIVAGKFRSGVWDYDSATVFLPLEKMQEFLRQRGRDPIEPPSITTIAIALDDYDAHGLAALEAVERACPGYRVRTWEDVQANLMNAVQNEMAIQIVILFFIVIVASFTIFSIYMMMVRAKQRDIGVLRALGATGSGVTAAFTMSGAFCGLVGSALGIALGLFLAANLDPFVTYVRAVSRGLAAQPRAVPVAAFAAFIGALGVLIVAWKRLYDRPSPLASVWTAALALGGFWIYSRWTTGFVPDLEAREPSAYGPFPLGVWIWLLAAVLLGLFYRRPALATLGHSMLAGVLLLVGGISAAVVFLHPRPGFAGFDLFPRQVYHLERVPVRIDGEWIVAVVVATFAIGAVASIWPAVRASRYDPLEAIRDE
jgi:lipoprotein-releasing system permease protein